MAAGEPRPERSEPPIPYEQNPDRLCLDALLVDDHSRLAYSEVLPGEKDRTFAGFLERAIGYLAAHGITECPHGSLNKPPPNNRLYPTYRPGTPRGWPSVLSGFTDGA